MSIYERYARLCEDKGINPTAAAEQIGIPRSLVSKWKKSPDIRPTLRTIDKLCNYFHVDQTYFLEIEEPSERVLTGLSDEDWSLVQLVLAAPEEVKQSIKTLLRRP